MTDLAHGLPFAELRANAFYAVLREHLEGEHGH